VMDKGEEYDDEYCVRESIYKIGKSFLFSAEITLAAAWRSASNHTYPR